MEIDFSSVNNGEQKLIELAAGFSVDDLRAASNTSIDTLLRFIEDLNDEDMNFEPEDPEAHDPYAVPGEEHIGGIWRISSCM